MTKKETINTCYFVKIHLENVFIKRRILRSRMFFLGIFWARRPKFRLVRRQADAPGAVRMFACVLLLVWHTIHTYTACSLGRCAH
jgi:hypothetical protein